MSLASAGGWRSLLGGCRSRAAADILRTDEVGPQAAELDGQCMVLAEQTFHEANGVGREFVKRGAQTLLGFDGFFSRVLGGDAGFSGFLDERASTSELLDAAGGVEVLRLEVVDVGSNGIGHFANVAVFEWIVEVGHNDLFLIKSPRRWQRLKLHFFRHFDAEEIEAALQGAGSGVAEFQSSCTRISVGFQDGAGLEEAVESGGDFVEIIRQKIRPVIVQNCGQDFAELEQLFHQFDFSWIGK